MPEAVAPAPLRYTRVAIAFHWAIAALVLALLGIGLAMTHADLAPMRRFQLYQWHKSVGITVLVLSLLRLGWRAFHRPPPLPAAMPALERAAAHLAHGVLYALIIAMPLVGWALVSASPFNIPTVLYGVVPWPHLPIVTDLPNKAAVEAGSKLVHASGAGMQHEKGDQEPGAGRMDQLQSGLDRRLVREVRDDRQMRPGHDA
ncbi:MAG: cytochrome b, partial [Methylobacterium sp.]